MKFLVLLLPLLVCISCAHTYYHDKKSDREIASDMSKCRAQVGQARPEGIIEKNELMDECMYGKGYDRE